MNFNHTYNYNKALVIDASRMKELEDMILKYCNSIEYTGKTIAGTEISFNSLNELLSYGNSLSERLASIKVTGKENNHIKIEIEFYIYGVSMIFAYKNTCKVAYRASNIDEKRLILADTQEFLRKITARYWPFSKISIIKFELALLYFVGTVQLIFGLSGERGKTNLKLDIMVYVWSALYLIICYMIYKISDILDKKFIKTIFPSLIFAWGEESDTFNRNSDIRKQILWVIIFGLAISVLGGLIINYIKI